jgi:hypothetical protein
MLASAIARRSYRRLPMRPADDLHRDMITRHGAPLIRDVLVGICWTSFMQVDLRLTATNLDDSRTNVGEANV